MKIVYMGTPDFAVEPLKALLESRHEVSLVVTQPDRMKGRGKKMLPPPVKVLAEEKGIRVLQPTSLKGNEEFLEEIRTISPDACVVAAYGRILPPELLEIPKFGCINIHASLLPRWRGAAPMQYAIIHGDEEAGVTTMQMAEGLDTGDMLEKDSIPVDGMYYPTLSDKLSKMGGKLIVSTLDKIEKGEITAEKQDDNLATYAGLINKEEGHIDFGNKNADEIDRMIRAFEPWPGAYGYIGETMIKFKAGEKADPEACPLEISIDKEPGTVIKADNSGIYIKTKEDIFCLKELQIPGKNWMDAGSYLRGHKLEIGEVFR